MIMTCTCHLLCNWHISSIRTAVSIVNTFGHSVKHFIARLGESIFVEARHVCINIVARETLLLVPVDNTNDNTQKISKCHATTSNRCYNQSRNNKVVVHFSVVFVLRLGVMGVT